MIVSVRVWTGNVAEAGGDFDEPIYQNDVRSYGHAVPEAALEPATTYRWRLIHEPTGQISPESKFTTARYPMQF